MFIATGCRWALFGRMNLNYELLILNYEEMDLEGWGDFVVVHGWRVGCLGAAC